MGKQEENPSPVYIGTGAALMHMLRTRKDVRDELDIIALIEPDGFKCRWVDGKQQEGEKDFRMALDEEFALYQKQGWERMACSKPKHQFDLEATLGQRVDFPEDDVVANRSLDKSRSVLPHSGNTDLNEIRATTSFTTAFLTAWDSPTKLLESIPKFTIDKELVCDVVRVS